MKPTKLLKILFTAALALLITGCNSDGDSGKSPVAPLAPAGIPGGVVMAINPNITFNGGGTSGTFSYENLAGDISDFPAVIGAITGNWTFTRDSDAQFTLFIDFTDALLPDLTLVFSGFVGNNTAITSMLVSIQGGAADINVDLSGTPLVPTAPPATGGGTGGGSGSLPPDTVLGEEYFLILDFIEDANVPGNFPYALNDVERFTFSSSGQLFIGDAQTNLGLPENPQPNNFFYEDSARGLFFGVSVIDGNLSEINVFGGPTGPFYGQFVEGSGGTGGTGGTGDVGNSAVAGTYNVTLQTTETSPGPVDSRVGLATTPTVSTTFTVFDNNSDGTPESIQFPGGSPTPLSSDGITSWVFSTFYDGNGESIIVNAIKNSTTQEISTISVTYLEAGFDPSLGVIDTNYTWTSGTSVSKQ